MKHFTFSAAAVALMVCPAFGTVTVDILNLSDSGRVVNRLNVDTENAWRGASLIVELTQGSVINLHPIVGGVDFAWESSPNPPPVFDTHIARSLNSGLAAGAVELGGPPEFNLGPTDISAEWLGDGAAGPLVIANLVFSDDAVGTWSLGMFESHNAQADFIGGTLTGGVLLTDFVPGDLNVDGFTGIDDLNIVLGEWNTDGSGDPRSDPTGDGFVGIDDLNDVLGDWNAGAAQGPWSYTPTGQPGDLDGDGWVGLEDLNIILGSWHTDASGNPLADPSGDGFVGLDDYNIVITFWQTGTPPIAVVPEPIGLGLISLGALALLRKRQA